MRLPDWRIWLGVSALLLGFAAGDLRGQLSEDERNTIEVVRKIKNSVVFITNIQYVRDFFLFDEQVTKGSGSGFIWDENGHVVTNYHVIEDGDLFSVTLPSQEQRRARLVGKEEKKDIAVLKLEGDLSGLSPVRAGRSRDLQVGQKVVAVGNPFGFDHTVTCGIVSALGRKILGAGDVTIRDMIQTDASINPGNSGGPLLNSSGELIGMNTMIYSRTGSSSGIGFAVPVDTISKIVPEIIQYGRVIRPGLGVSLLVDRYARRLGIEGAVIMEVPRNSGAYRLGLRGLERDRQGRWFLRDVIIAVDGAEVSSYDDLYNTLENYRIGDSVMLTVKRGDKKRTLKIRLVSVD